MAEMFHMAVEFQQVRLFFVGGYVSIAVGVKESFTTWFFQSVDLNSVWET